MPRTPGISTAPTIKSKHLTQGLRRTCMIGLCPCGNFTASGKSPYLSPFRHAAFFPFSLTHLPEHAFSHAVPRAWNALPDFSPFSSQTFLGKPSLTPSVSPIRSAAPTSKKLYVEYSPFLFLDLITIFNDILIYTAVGLLSGTPVR